jgi:hypothetical protein
LGGFIKRKSWIRRVRSLKIRTQCLTLGGTEDDVPSFGRKGGTGRICFVGAIVLRNPPSAKRIRFGGKSPFFKGGLLTTSFSKRRLGDGFQSLASRD